ncbi:MAG: hypothetical protein KDE47_27195, partial [Caldilineaceae bacterium]|nr:hypothetical protein [Caldilineaceae bacterium]
MFLPISNCLFSPRRRARFYTLCAHVLVTMAGLFSSALLPGAIHAVSPASTLPPSAPLAGSSFIFQHALVLQLQQQTAAPVEIRTRAATNTVRAVRTAPGANLGAASTGASMAMSVRQKSTAFLNSYGALFGLQQPDQELILRAVQRDAQGITHVQYAQQYAGIPVFGSRLTTHIDAQGHLYAVDGATVAAAALSQFAQTPTLAAAEARQIAERAASAAADAQPGQSVALQLYFFQEGLTWGRAGPLHLAYEVTVA